MKYVLLLILLSGCATTCTTECKRVLLNGGKITFRYEYHF